MSIGLRRSELLGLTWDRIDLEEGMVTVDRQLHSDGRRLAPVKTRHSNRVVPLSAVAIRALKAHRNAYPPKPVTLQHTDGDTEHDALVVFASRTGKPVHSSWLGEVLRRARKAVGLHEAVTFHTLRHTFASILIAQGRSARAVQERMGHGSITVTMDIYGHLFPDEDAKSRDAIDTGLSGLTW